MIRIEVREDSITLTGHALFDEEGRDIVCAAISSLTLGSAEIWSKRKDVVCRTTGKGDYSFTFLWNDHNEDLRIQFGFLKDHYRLISQHYPDFVNYSEIQNNIV